MEMIAENYLFGSKETKAQQKYFVVICYDIIDNKRRGKLAKYLEAFGIRVQKSVFEGILTKKNYERLKHGIGSFAEDTDNIRVYKLTGNGDVSVWGDIRPSTEEEVIIM